MSARATAAEIVVSSQDLAESISRGERDVLQRMDEIRSLLETLADALTSEWADEDEPIGQVVRPQREASAAWSFFASKRSGE